LNVNICPSPAREALEEIVGQLRLEIANQAGANLCVYHRNRSSAQINRGHSQGFIHSHQEVSGAEDSFAISERLIERFAQRDTYILHAVMLIDIQVAMAA